MKKLTLLLVIIFTFLFSNTSWGEWEFIAENVFGSKYYYDKDRVRKRGKYLYFWDLIDFIKQTKGYFSLTKYNEIDCSILRYKVLKVHFYNNSMGEGEKTGELTPRDEWYYPQPESMRGIVFRMVVCGEGK